MKKRVEPRLQRNEEKLCFLREFSKVFLLPSFKDEVVDVCGVVLHGEDLGGRDADQAVPHRGRGGKADFFVKS